MAFSIMDILGPSLGVTPGSRADVYARVPGTALDFLADSTIGAAKNIGGGALLDAGRAGLGYAKDLYGGTSDFLTSDYDAPAPPGSLQAQISMADATGLIHGTDKMVKQNTAPAMALAQPAPVVAPQAKPEDYSGVRAGAYQFGSTPIDTSNFESMRDGLEANRYEMDMLGNSIDRREFDRNASMEDDIRRRAMEAKLDSLSPYVTGEPGFSGSGASNDPFRNNSFATPYTKGQVAEMDQERQKRAGQLEMEVAKARAEAEAKAEAPIAANSRIEAETAFVIDAIKKLGLPPEEEARRVAEAERRRDAVLGRGV
jgi:hypothetical protein